MHDQQTTWHIGHQAIYDYLDHSLAAQAVAEIDRHVERCAPCARAMREARTLFEGLPNLETPPLQVDLTPRVITSLLAARRSAVRWRWVLAGQAAAAVVGLAALGVRLEEWLVRLLQDPALAAIRQAGSRFLAELSGWLAPFLDLVPTLPTRLAPMHLPLPHLDGPAAGWSVLAGIALLLGVLGNALLLRPPDGAVPSVAGHGNGRSGDGRSRT